MDTLKLVLSDSFSLCWAKQSTAAEPLCGWDALVVCAPRPHLTKDLWRWHHFPITSLHLCRLRKRKCQRAAWPDENVCFVLDQSEAHEWSEGLCDKTRAHVSRHEWKDVSVLGRIVCAFMCLYGSVCVCDVIWYFCVFCRERGSSCRSQGAPGLYKTSAPAGRLQGRSGCVDSFLRQMKEQKWLRLVFSGSYGRLWRWHSASLQVWLQLTLFKGLLKGRCVWWGLERVCMCQNALSIDAKGRSYFPWCLWNGLGCFKVTSFNRMKQCFLILIQCHDSLKHIEKSNARRSSHIQHTSTTLMEDREKRQLHSGQSWSWCRSIQDICPTVRAVHRFRPWKNEPRVQRSEASRDPGSHPTV